MTNRQEGKENIPLSSLQIHKDEGDQQINK